LFLGDTYTHAHTNTRTHIHARNANYGTIVMYGMLSCDEESRGKGTAVTLSNL
jgi:hypothetical protein